MFKPRYKQLINVNSSLLLCAKASQSLQHHRLHFSHRIFSSASETWYLLCLASYKQCSTRLLKVLHKCCNTDVLHVDSNKTDLIQFLSHALNDSFNLKEKQLINTVGEFAITRWSWLNLFIYIIMKKLTLVLAESVFYFQYMVLWIQSGIRYFTVFKHIRKIIELALLITV